MKIRTNKIAITILILSLTLFCFVGCKKTNDKKPPEYLGVTITKDINSAQTAALNFEHVGYYNGEHTQKIDSVDKSQPFTKTIEEAISSNVTGTPINAFIANANDDIYVNIALKNEDLLTITSVTINETIYENSTFENASTKEKIIIKLNVGTAPGVTNYTINSIKYSDGSLEKSVTINKNKTAKVGIYSENQVAVEVSNVEIGLNSVSLKAIVSDAYNLIPQSSGTLKAVIFDGENILQEKTLTTNENTITFDALNKNTLYQYAIVGYYDDLTENGFTMNVLYKDAFYTDSILLFDNVKVGYDSACFELKWNNSIQNKNLTSLKLYDNNTFIKDIDTSNCEITNILSNRTYTIIAEYVYNNNTESVQLEITTCAKQEPIVNITAKIEGINVVYNVVVNDANSLLNVSKVEFWRDGNMIMNLTYNTKYTFTNMQGTLGLKIYYNYDLNDGNGIVEKVVDAWIENRNGNNFNPDWIN